MDGMIPPYEHLRFYPRTILILFLLPGFSPSVLGTNATESACLACFRPATPLSFLRRLVLAGLLAHAYACERRIRPDREYDDRIDRHVNGVGWDSTPPWTRRLTRVSKCSMVMPCCEQVGRTPTIRSRSSRMFLGMFFNGDTIRRTSSSRSSALILDFSKQYGL